MPGAAFIRSIRWAALAAFLLLVLLPIPAFAQQVVARLLPPSGTIEDTITLEVELTGSSRVRWGSLESQDFQVVGQRSFSRQHFNGQTLTSITSLSLVLRPLRTGTLSTGQLRYTTESGAGVIEPQTIEIREVGAPAPRPTPSAGPGGTPAIEAQRPSRVGTALPPTVSDAIPQNVPPLDASLFHVPWPTRPNGAFIMAWVSTDRAVVGQQILVDYVLYTPLEDMGLDITALSEPAFEGVWFRSASEIRLGPGGRGVRLEPQNINNRFYNADLFATYLLVPLEEGTLVVPPFEIEARRPSFRRAGPAATILSEPVEITVQPVPAPDGARAAAPGSPVGHLTLDASVDRSHLRVGDTALLTIRVDGAAYAPLVRPPDVPDIATARVLDPNDDSSTRLGRSGWVESTITRQVAIVPTEPGEWSIPALEFSYWDPWRIRWVTRTTEPIKLTVQPGDPGAVLPEEGSQPTEWLSTLPPARPAQSSGPGATPAPALSPTRWVLLAIPPVLWLMLLTGGGIQRASQKRSPERQRKRAHTVLHESLRQAADAGNAAEAMAAIRTWFLAMQDASQGGVSAEAARRIDAAHSGLDAAGLWQIHRTLADLRYTGEQELPSASREAILAWLAAQGGRR
jgi:hypothetical protein